MKYGYIRNNDRSNSASMHSLRTYCVTFHICNKSFFMDSTCIFYRINK